MSPPIYTFDIENCTIKFSLLDPNSVTKITIQSIIHNYQYNGVDQDGALNTITMTDLVSLSPL